MKKKYILFVQLGSPKSPSVIDVKNYLCEFLGDPRVVDLNPFLWKIILYFFILPFRSFHSSKLYHRIWNGREFPLISNTDLFCKYINKFLPSDIEARVSYLLGSNRFNDFYEEWYQLALAGDEREVLVVPLFPQYSEATTASVFDLWTKFLATKVWIPKFKILNHFHLSKAFIDSSVLNISNKFIELKNQGINIDTIILSFHGIPLRRVLVKKDPYLEHCLDTYILIKSEVLKKLSHLLNSSNGSGFSSEDICISFQSRFGSEVWLNPYTSQLAHQKISEGSKHLLIYCPSFTADCLETIDEIGCELNNELKLSGGNAHLVSCLNADKDWAKQFADYLLSEIGDNKSQGFTEENFEEKNQKEYIRPKSLERDQFMDTIKQQDTTLSPFAKKTMKIVFLTLFLDLVSFSIIFPLFPALAKYYIQVDSDNYFLNLIFSSIEQLTSSGSSKMASIVLFGGALGGLYSFLQFFASPLWGGWSDRIGRKPILIISISGLLFSYVLWFFSGNFTLLILARFIGGIMGGNISTATAVVADITNEKNRSKGMAIIGISFATGFIIGPALGGILSMIDLTQIFPSLIGLGGNPFSAPAALAGILCLINLIQVIFNFKETLPAKLNQKNDKASLKTVKSSERSINPLSLFKPLPIKEVNMTNLAYFLFLSAFSGMEFTLTFLAVDRMNYSSMDNAYMFIFIGFILTLVQGGYVRRKAHQIGEAKMAMHGMICIIPGLIIISMANVSWMLYLGLFFLAIGSGQIIPCLTALVSIFSPQNLQGKSIGLFRSLGAFARVIGPISAAILYWRYGSKVPYLIGAAAMIFPLILVSKLPKSMKSKS